VSVSALVPTGIARGDVVRVVTPDLDIEGAVLAARSSGKPEAGPPWRLLPRLLPATSRSPTTTPDRRRRGDVASLPAATAPTTTGGEGRVTVAVDRSEATALLRADRGRVLVLSRGTRREYELTALLRRTGKRFRKVSVVAGGPLDGTLSARPRSARRTTWLFAARHESWTIAPGGSQSLSAGDDLFVVGSRDALDRFVEVAA